MGLKETQRKRELIGRVSVDSGQLMVIDPSYIESQWKRGYESSILGIKFWGGGQDNAVRFLENKGYTITVEDGKHLIKTRDENEILKIQEDLVRFLETDSGKIVFTTVDEGTYDQVCKTTSSEKKSGQIEGFMGVAFESGFGDGLYEVYATYESIDLGPFKDERISKVEIILI